MGGRLIDYIAQGAAADIPLAADMPARIADGGASIYYEQDTGAFRFFNSSTIAWDLFTSQTDEVIQDMLATFLVHGAGITLTYDDTLNTLTIDCTITQYTNEMAMDAIAAMLAAGVHTGITVSYNDAGDAMSLACTVTQYTDEMAQDAVAALIAAGVDTGLSISYNDAGNAISFSVNVAADTDIWGGTNDSKFITPKRLKDWRTPVSVADAATITLDGSTGVNFYVTLGGNRILANPTNFSPGQFGVIHFTQDGTGTRTLTCGSNWKFGAVSINGSVLTTTAGAVDAIHYYVRTDGTITCSLIAGLTASPAKIKLDNLANIDVSTPPTDGQVLTYNNASSKWKPAAAAGGGGGISSGSAFPGSPSVNDLFYRTDRELLYYWDGTRWLSSQLFTYHTPFTALGGTLDAYVPIITGKGNNGVYVESMERTLFRDNTAQWDVSLFSCTVANAVTTVGFIAGTDEVLNNFIVATLAINAVVANTQKIFRVHVERISGSGAAYGVVIVLYRLIG